MYQILEKRYPCRVEFMIDLFNLMSKHDESLPPAIFVNGHAGTGKSSIVKAFIHHVKKDKRIRVIYINCVECYTIKILLENTIAELINNDNDDTASFRCDSFIEFVQHLKYVRSKHSDLSYIAAFDSADRLRSMDENVLACLLQLQHITGLNICVILISQIPFEKYQSKMGLSQVINLRCLQYSKGNILKILTDQFEIALQVLKHDINICGIRNVESFEYKMKVVENITTDFFNNYLNVFISVLYKACRNISELKFKAIKYFLIYMKPVLNGSIDVTEVNKLWRNLSSHLCAALSYVCIRYDKSHNNILGDFPCGVRSGRSIREVAQSLELPLYGKYLVIAAFLAGYNSAKEDRRLFLKRHGRRRKRMQTINTKFQVSEKMSTSLSANSFSIDRLLAIFYSILDEKVGLTCSLLSQISTLVRLKLLAFVSGENNIMDGSTRLQCTVGLEFVLYIAKFVDFNICHYLCNPM